ncbi:phosphoenolpyruvate--protein phosphotransferase [Balneolales bacterium ANBcel1]|nr:phosphoenolpyruvate--protein phosphotransferase [Balneolales bacterium ANBcel1]
MEDQRSYESNEKINGLTAVSGLVMGVARLYSKGNINIDAEPIEEDQKPEEIRKFEQARQSVSVEVKRLTDFADSREDQQTRDILNAQLQILQDPDLITSVNGLIDNQNMRAEKAVYDSFQQYIDLIKSSDKSFLVSRLSDLRDVRDRLVRNIQQLAVIASFGKDTVMVTAEVTPLEVVTFARNGVKGIICNAGGLTSHASIIANAMGIPMLIDTKTATRQIRDGDTVILDGYNKNAILRPDEETAGLYIRAIKRHKEEEKQLRHVVDKPAETLCGHKVTLQANIDFEDEVLNIEKYRAEGIGLLRTDTLLMNAGPVTMDRKRQEEFCQTAYSGSGSSPVTIRLLDVGGDKVLDIKTREANPFLGWRGIRILLDRKELLRSQLEAICRVAGQYPGRTRILVPMISTLDEFLEVKHVLDETQERVQKKGVPVDNHIQLGVMVEVPSVALLADLFAQHADFLSIGTNDLTQYTLAVDRGNNLISSLYQPLHPAVLTFIAMSVEAGTKHDKPVAVCGELSSDPFAALVLIGLGVNELSMTPRLIPSVKQAVRLHSMDEMKELAKAMQNASTLEQSRQLKADWKKSYQQKLKKERTRPGS